MNDVDEVYSFAFRGLLAEDALDSAGRSRNLSGKYDEEKVAERLSIDLLDKECVKETTSMSIVYIAIASFEKSLRKLISTVLLEQVGANWWGDAVSPGVRKKAEARRDEEAKIRWHTPRGDEPLNYTEMGDLASIINQNWEKFEPFMRNLEWTKQILSTLERSRNVIMHSGMLEMEDVERVGMQIRDWVKQVGA